jgi:hypothetical protein
MEGLVPSLISRCSYQAGWRKVAGVRKGLCASPNHDKEENGKARVMAELTVVANSAATP